MTIMDRIARLMKALRKLEERINIAIAPWVSPEKNYRSQWKSKK